MTRIEWYKHYREKRIERKQIQSLSGKTLNEMFKDYYGCILSEKDRAKVELIDKYRDKVSYRLKQEYKVIKEKGKENSKAAFKELLFGDNYILKHIQKDDIWTGGALITPFKK